MKNITLMGLEYDESMINTLKRFNEYMSKKTNEMIEKVDSEAALIETMMAIEVEKTKYINNLQQEEKETIIHFCEASTVKEHKPIISSIPCIPAIMLSCVIPSLTGRIIVSALIAGILTLNASIFLNQRAYNKIMNLVLSKSN